MKNQWALAEGAAGKKTGEKHEFAFPPFFMV